MFSLGNKKSIFFSLTVAAFQTSFFDQVGSIGVNVNCFLPQNSSAWGIRGNLHAV